MENEIKTSTGSFPLPDNIINSGNESAFVKAVDDVKLNILDDAGRNDQQFIKEVRDNVKEATITLTEVEKEKAELKKQNVIYEQEIKEKERKINEYESQEHKWENKQKARQYHYDGVKPIMLFIGVKEPLNLVMLYILTLIVTPVYLLSRIWLGTVGALIHGAETDDRPKAVKGFIWTMLGIMFTIACGFVVIFILKYFNFIS